LSLSKTSVATAQIPTRLQCILSTWLWHHLLQILSERDEL
jgi:hypothetical protein